MKTRILHTRFWQDNFVMNLSRESRLLFNYLLTNQYINISGIYECPDRTIMFETGLTEAQLEQGKKDLQGKVFFIDGWVRVLNVDRYNSYRNSPKNEIAYDREMESAPEQLKDTSIDTSIHTPINNKSEIINNKSEIKEVNFSKITDITQGVIEEVAEKYHVKVEFVEWCFDNLENYCSAHGKKYKNYKSALINFVKRDMEKYQQQMKQNKRGGVVDVS